MNESVLIMDPAGLIVWANRGAHVLAGAPPGALLGRSYLDFCPPDTHAVLLDLHRRKLAGETVRFDLALGSRRLRVTSGPVRTGDRVYLYSVARPARARAKGDEELIGQLAAAEAVPGGPKRLDLNACLVGALKDEAKRLKGRLGLVPGRPPAVRARPWPLRMVLRELLVGSAPERGRLRVSTGGSAKGAWLRIEGIPGKARLAPALAVCRRVLGEQGARLEHRAGSLTLRFRPA